MLLIDIAAYNLRDPRQLMRLFCRIVNASISEYLAILSEVRKGLIGYGLHSSMAESFINEAESEAWEVMVNEAG